MIRISRKAIRYEPRRPHRDVELVSRLKTLCDQYPRCGYLMLHGMLRTEGVVENPKANLSAVVRTGYASSDEAPCKLIRPHVPMALPSRPNERWSADSYTTSSPMVGVFGFSISSTTTLESASSVHVDLSISRARMVRPLDELRETRGLPKTLALENGPEMTSKAMLFWSTQNGVKLHFIQPGKPTQNAFVESFNGRFRAGCLNQHWFVDVADARQIIAAWRYHYNTVRPHSSLGYRPPALFETAV